MGPSLAIASGLEGRLRPGVLDFKGDPPPGGRRQETAGVSPSAPAPRSNCLSLAFRLHWAEGVAAARAAWLQGMETRGVWRAAGPKGAVTAGWQAQGNGLGGCQMRPGFSPAALKTPQSTSVLARKPIGYLSHHSRLWAGGWGWSGPGAKTSFRIHSRRGQFPGRGCLSQHRRGLPNPDPRPCGRDRILQRRSQEQTLPPATPRHPNPKAMRVRVYRNYVQSPEKSFHTLPPEKKKTRQNSSIYSVSGVHLNINCVIFIHFLSLNSPLIYQFIVSWGFFSTGGFPAPHPTPLFDLRRLILSIVAFRPHVTTL